MGAGPEAGTRGGEVGVEIGNQEEVGVGTWGGVEAVTGKEARGPVQEAEREGGGAEEGFHVKEEPADSGYNDQYGNYDYQGINVKQEKVEGGDESIAEHGEMMEPVDRNLPMAAPGEEGDYGY